MAIVSESVAHILFHVQAIAGQDSGTAARAQLVEDALAPFVTDNRDLTTAQFADELRAGLPGNGPGPRRAREALQWISDSGWGDLTSAVVHYVDKNLLPDDEI